MSNGDSSDKNAHRRMGRFFTIAFWVAVLCAAGAAACDAWLDRGGPMIVGLFAFFLAAAGFMWPAILGKIRADEEWGENSKRELAAFGGKCFVVLLLGGVACLFIITGLRSIHDLTVLSCILGVLSLAIGLVALSYTVYFAATPWHLIPKDRDDT